MIKSIGSTWILNALQVAAVLVLSPYVLHQLGPDANGVWVTIVSLTGILSLLILGVPMASVRFIAERVARKDVAGTNAAISTCLSICTALGVGALLVGTVFYGFFASHYLGGAQAAGIPLATIEGARIAFAVVVLQVAFGFAMRLPYGIFDAHGDFVVRNGIMAGEVALRFVLTLALLSWHAALPVLASVQIVCMLAEFLACWTLIRRRYPHLAFDFGAFDRTLVRRILGFSVFAMLLNVGTLLAFRIDALVIGAQLEPRHATFFDVGNKFFDPMTGLLIAVGAVVMPTVTRLNALGDVRELRHVFLKWSKICLSIVLAIGIYLLVAGPRFLGWWVGPEFVDPSGRVLQVLMLSFLAYLPVRGVALPVLMGLGKPNKPALALLAMGVVNLAISLALVKPLGIFGVALGTAIPNVIFAWFILKLACDELGITLREYGSYVAGRAAAGALLPLGFLWLVRESFDLTSLPELVSAGVAMLSVFALVWIGFVYRDDPYVDVRGAITRVVSRRFARRTP